MISAGYALLLTGGFILGWAMVSAWRQTLRRQEVCRIAERDAYLAQAAARRDATEARLRALFTELLVSVAIREAYRRQRAAEDGAKEWKNPAIAEWDPQGLGESF